MTTEPIVLPNGEGTLIVNSKGLGSVLGTHSCGGGLYWTELTFKEDVVCCRHCLLRMRVPLGVPRSPRTLRHWCDEQVLAEKRVQEGVAQKTLPFEEKRAS